MTADAEASPDALSIRIARATAADLEPVRATRLQALEESPGAFGSTLERELAFDDDTWLARLGNGAWFLAWNGPQPVGMACGIPEEGRPDLRQLVAMWVDPSVRGTGAAAALVEEVVAWAAEDGAASIYLWVAEGNDRALRLYQRLGFEPTDEAGPLPSAPERCEHKMIRSLA